MANMLYQWLFMICISIAHPFFVSMTDLNYNPKDKDIEVSVRIFTDDLENTLRKYHTGRIDILHPQDQQQMNAFVNEYIQKHLQLKVNGKSVDMSFIGYEEQNESIWTYLQVNNVNNINSISIENNLLHDYNTNQINMLHAKVGDKEQSTKLDYPQTHAEFSF